jgi:pimeloyl-ACP methyl ester carboxylesterase
MQLRAGTYDLGGMAARPFSHVVLGGHSGGAQGSELEAYSFGGIDGLMIFAHADQGPTLRGVTEGLQEGVVCLLGGQQSEPGGPGQYAYFGQTPADWQADYFQGAEQRIVDAATPLRHRDPCGDVGSFVQLAALNSQNLKRITVPVLLLYGLSDALFSQPSAGQTQKGFFSGSSDVTLDYFPGAGHALTLENSAPAIRTTVDTWLSARGLG